MDLLPIEAAEYYTHQTARCNPITCPYCKLLRSHQFERAKYPLTAFGEADTIGPLFRPTSKDKD